MLMSSKNQRIAKTGRNHHVKFLATKIPPVGIMNQIPGQVFIIYLDVSIKNENVNFIVTLKERSREHHQD